ncbi:MAG: ATP-dependent Clp protease ATP-binding subunit [Bacteriovoracaceae bacterium]|jgi:ATP-dependent Clp protease ATP-binding subunit ClpC|nr:ATP-dependent Clp protease ATP-binding subunit [Bacteriovoracaceae bacterium]
MRFKKFWSTVLLMCAGTSLYAADCSKFPSENFDWVKKTPSGHCLGLRVAGNQKASNILEGDMVWIEGNKPYRIGAEPGTFVFTKSGVMGVYFQGRNAEIRSWTSLDKSIKPKICRKNISIKDLRSGKIRITPIRGKGYAVQEKVVSQSYFEGCEKSGKGKIFADLTESDRISLQKYSPFSHLSNDLTDPETNATLPEILGRDELVDKLIARFRNDSKRSTMLWGPAGVGKTALAYRLATRIVRGEVPDWLKDWSVHIIDLGAVNGEGFSGLAEKKMTEIVKAASGKKTILLMDEIHQLVGMGTGENDSSDVTEVMKTNLANGQLAVIGTLTDAPGEMSLVRQKEAFFSRFTRIHVSDPNDDVLMMIYKYKAKKARRRTNVIINDKLLKHLVRLTRQYIPDEHHPRVGITFIELMENQLAPADDSKTYTATKTDLEALVGEYANVIVLKRGKDKRSFLERVVDFQKDVRKKYVGQGKAVDAIEAELLNLAANNKKDERPAGIFLFLGPSGVGKSYLAKTTGKMFEMTPKLFPMSQYTSDADVNTLFGAPEGYVGYNPAGGLLVRWVKNNPTSTLIFDEIDKAHAKIFDSLLSLLEDGEVASKGGGVTAKFSNGFIFFTSNFGMDMIDAYDVNVLKIPEPSGHFGKKYKEEEIPKTENGLKQRILNDLIKDQKFGSYFAGRISIDNIVVFHHLNPEEGRKIAVLETANVKRMFVDANKVVLDPKVVTYIADQGVDFRFGARSLRYVAHRVIKNPVNRAIVELKKKDILPEKYDIGITLKDAKTGEVDVTITEAI